MRPETADVEVYFGIRWKRFEKDLQGSFESVDFILHTSGAIDDENDFC